MKIVTVSCVLFDAVGSEPVKTVTTVCVNGQIDGVYETAVLPGKRRNMPHEGDIIQDAINFAIAQT